MDPLKLPSGVTLTWGEVHPLMVSSLLTAGMDEMQGRAAECAYLGLAARGDPKPPLRSPGEPVLSYGQRVYDWLSAQGMSHMDILRTASRMFADACTPLYSITAEEVADMGGPSSPVTSSPDSTPPIAGQVTHSAG